ncbi:hypothetical protein OIE62_12610 [Streptomyces scopuliridis]|uniref:Small hydrophilic protein n=2 Tax=Streptomyces scopuliridis TaxID=452529 RepID=A0A2T7TG66_9ACTN|nr:hypothetical protein [Streptomyces scopuliridis]PVE14154.1 hypothetical protein Y717_19040 [Streptomyces scopuliridis RB72]WSB36309.1 hypothetical protein OG949_28040 [Streptomyces scopuliridis]WSC00605.1 hypothetical protein OG835_28785 [Streptomyces scopuliridis]WSC05784.1 hypothetical protein OIE62_12610 [Streptomyces scopuliridis]
MAKHKNRDRSNRQHARSDAERGTEESKSSSMEDRSEQVQSRITPTDVAHKGKQKRFGHN